jgi:vacuolar-type H+-ATPase subunit B/Vma2
MKSAIGEGMTRDDHSAVSNQLVCPLKERLYIYYYLNLMNL